jgi:hypothetical protein
MAFNHPDSAEPAAQVTRLPGSAVAAATSIGAGAIHAAAAGIHAEHVGLARLFVIVAALQLAAGLVALARPSRLAIVAVAAVNAAAVGGWLVTRLTGISWIDGLTTRESPQFADAVCALLGTAAVATALAGLLVGTRPTPRPRLLLPSIAIAALSVPAMFASVGHVHSGAHDHAAGTHTAGDDHSADDHAAGDDHTAGDDHGTGAGTEGASGSDHGHDGTVPTEPGAAAWPRPWDPAAPLDLSGVVGVSLEQELRAMALVENTLRELPRFADPADAEAAGYRSIGDGGTGSEHFIKGSLIEDDDLLNASAPESLVYDVVDGKRTLAGAMYIASARESDDPTLTNWAGALMTWHEHDNLCWGLDANGTPVVMGVIDSAGNCARGVRAGGGNPMVHVWIRPHACGVFAALEGVGAGTAAVPESERVDMCKEDHGDHGGEGHTTGAVAKPYDPSKPIDLSGTPGVTEAQQAAAENLIAVTLFDLPQWSDYRVAEAAGFSSIGDGRTGHEHFVNWAWINDDITLDPDFPESLVYEPQPDGSRKLVSAMYMLPDSVALTDVPNIGGALMQWHIHDDLCFTLGDAPRVAGITTPSAGCPAGQQKFPPAPMIHVWIVPHRCGPFAALEGVGAGTIAEGEERLCDHAHGASA